MGVILGIALSPQANITTRENISPCRVQKVYYSPSGQISVISDGFNKGNNFPKVKIGLSNNTI